MDLFSDLKELNKETLIRVCIFFFAFLSPGLLSIYSINPKMFADLETTKLILLSISITAPTFMLFFITTSVSERVLTAMNYLPPGRLGGFDDWYITHGLANAQMFYFVVLLSFLFDLSLKAFVWWIVGLFLSLIIFEFIRVLKFARSENFNPKISDPDGAR